MNERIKELWENCDDIHVVYPRQGSPIYASPELLEKFAELIVEQMHDFIIEESANDNGIPDLGKVKQYFGFSELKND